jgi:hypothetical protein
MAEQLRDWPVERFIDEALARLPSPRNPETGEKLWDRGIKLQGNQAAVIKSRARFKQARGGWRAGKSFDAAVALYMDYGWRTSVRDIKDDLYGVIGDSYMMAEEEMRHLHWLFEAAQIPHDFHTPERQSWTIRFPHNGVEFRTMTAADITKIASRAYRGIVLAEGAQLAAEVFTNAKGRVLETRGWILIEGTFEDAGAWFYSIAEDWQKDGAEGETWPLPSWENLVVFPGGREDPAILSYDAGPSALPPDVFLEKLGGEPQRRSDLVMRFADPAIHVRHRFPRQARSFDPELPVTLFGDPGTSHAYGVAAAQFVQPQPGWNNDCWIIDFIYRWGRTAEQIIEEAVARPWSGSVEAIVLDFAARQRNANGPSNVEQWQLGWRQKTGRYIAVIADQVPLAAGYDAHKRLLLNSWPEDEAARRFNPDKKLRRVTSENGPRIFFAPEAAPSLFGGWVDGQRYLGEYNLHKNKKNRDGTVTRDDPIDQDNDAIKALNYGLWNRYGPVGDRTRLFNNLSSMKWEMAYAS